MQVLEKVKKVAKHCLFQCFAEGQKVCSLKRQVRSHLGDEKWKMGRCCGAKHIAKSTCQKHFMLGELWDVEMWKKCTPLRHEAHVEVTHTYYSEHFVSWDTPLWSKAYFEVNMFRPGAFLEVEMLKEGTPLWHDHEAHFEVKMLNAKQKYNMSRPLLEIADKVPAVVVQSTFRSQKVGKSTFLDHF